MRIEGVSRLEKAYLWVATRVPFLRKLTTRVIVNRYARAAPPRPRPYSMAADGYTSWTGLSDPTYTGRHLPPREPSARKEPSVEEVVELFLRRPGEPGEPARDTSLLFPFFAQWFTDSFLRTHPLDPRKNQSNHGIDLLQIYGAAEAQTKLLRTEGGFLDSQRIDGEEYAVHLFEDGPDGRPQLRERFRTLYTPENFERVFVNNPKMTDEHRRRALAVGLEHGNSTLGNVLMNTIFLREHNRLVRLLRDRYDWDDDRLFETARNINIVMVLKIVIEDYIPHISRVYIPLQALPGIWDREPWYRTNRMARSPWLARRTTPPRW